MHPVALLLAVPPLDGDPFCIAFLTACLAATAGCRRCPLLDVLPHIFSLLMLVLVHHQEALAALVAAAAAAPLATATLAGTNPAAVARAEHYDWPGCGQDTHAAAMACRAVQNSATAYGRRGCTRPPHGRGGGAAIPPYSACISDIPAQQICGMLIGESFTLTQCASWFGISTPPGVRKGGVMWCVTGAAARRYAVHSWLGQRRSLCPACAPGILLCDVFTVFSLCEASSRQTPLDAMLDPRSRQSRPAALIPLPPRLRSDRLTSCSRAQPPHSASVEGEPRASPLRTAHECLQHGYAKPPTCAASFHAHQMYGVEQQAPARAAAGAASARRLCRRPPAPVAHVVAAAVDRIFICSTFPSFQSALPVLCFAARNQTGQPGPQHPARTTAPRQPRDAAPLLHLLFTQA